MYGSDSDHREVSLEGRHHKAAHACRTRLKYTEDCRKALMGTMKGHGGGWRVEP